MLIGTPAKTAHAFAPACTWQAADRASRGLAGLVAMGGELQRD